MVTKPTPAPPRDDHDFLQWMLHQADQKRVVSANEVTRLRQLADYADTPFPSENWTGCLDFNEVAGAVAAARRRIRANQTTTKGMLVPK